MNMDNDYLLTIQPLDPKRFLTQVVQRIPENKTTGWQVDRSLTPLNEVWGEENALRAILQEIRADYRDKWKRFLPSNARPLRLGLLSPIPPTCTMAQLRGLAEQIKKDFEISTLQIHLHRDELGWNEEGLWRPCPHAHFVFLWYDFHASATLKVTTSTLSALQKLVERELYQGERSDTVCTRQSVVAEELLLRMNRIENKLNAVLSTMAPPSSDEPALQRKLLSVSEIAYICSVATGTVYNWINAGKLNGYKINGRLQFTYDEVKHFLQQNTNGNYTLTNALSTLDLLTDPDN